MSPGENRSSEPPSTVSFPSGVGLQPLRFGPLKLKTNLFLSPLAGYTSLPFRLTVRELGGLDLATTDLVNAHSLLRRNPSALKLVATCAEDTPLAVQLFGADSVVMRDAGQMLESMGIASVDINMGCPVRKVTRTGSGATLMTSPAAAADLVGTMVDGLRIPVTAKMRLGWDQANLTAPDLARALEGAGASAVFVHGRTRAQGFSGRVNLRGIARVVEAVAHIPVIGNGDVTTPESAARMLAETGCAGVSVGRGAFYDPWIFTRTERYLKTGDDPGGPDFEQRIDLMGGHLDRMIAFHGETLGCRLFRKVAPWYTRQFGPAKFFRRRISELTSREVFDGILDEYREWRRQFLDDDGQLLERYRPAVPYSSFMDAEDEDRMDGITVPKGPTAIW